MAMTLSNFVVIHVKGDSCLNKQFFAEVDVTTGMLWWKKTVRRKIRREYGSAWHFVDTGEFTPGYQAENLARAWRAQTGQEA